MRRNVALFRRFLKRELSTRYLRQRNRPRVGASSSAGAARGLLLRVHPDFPRGRLPRQQFPDVRRSRPWPWLAAQEGLQRAATVLSGYSGLIRKVAFPHEIVVYASVAATLALQFAGYLAVLLALALFGEPVHFEGLLLAVPLWIVMAIAVTGVALGLAALQVFVRDVEHVLMPVLMIVMYSTPILYPRTLVPETVRPWIAANPFAWLVDRLREALLDGRLTPTWNDAAAAVTAVLLLLGGRWLFRRLSPHFEDFV